MTKVLVTGVTGFVGSHCAVELLKQGYDVVGIDNYDNSHDVNEQIFILSQQSLSLLTEAAPGTYSFYKANIMDKNSVDEVFREHAIDVVMHMAGKKAVSESITNPLIYYQSNILTSCNVFSAALRYNADKIIFSSSATVYGVPQYLPLNEDHPTGQNITSPYGKTKHTIEEMLRDLVACNDTLSVVVLRYFNPCGAHPSHLLGEAPKGNPNNLFPVIAQCVRQRKPVSVFGTDFATRDGTAVRDYIHIDDLARGHVDAVRYACSTYHGFFPFNLGTGDGYSVREILETYADTNGVKVRSEDRPRRRGDVDELVCDATRAQAELRWTPQKTLKEMCHDSWQYSKKYALHY
jgi:UDP-glucose 4-epimerase